MKEKEIERALEIVYCNRDKFKITYAINSNYNQMLIRTYNGLVVVHYRYPERYIVYNSSYKELFDYDNRTRTVVKLDVP